MYSLESQLLQQTWRAPSLLSVQSLAIGPSLNTGPSCTNSPLLFTSKNQGYPELVLNARDSSWLLLPKGRCEQGPSPDPTVLVGVDTPVPGTSLP